MKLIVDENIAYAIEAFSQFGNLKLVNGRSISNNDIKDADVLIVRSITRVDEKLLAGSRVRFVGTATIGTDHIDLNIFRNKISNSPMQKAAMLIQLLNTFLLPC